jgi:hypothetical protein
MFSPEFAESRTMIVAPQISDSKLLINPKRIGKEVWTMKTLILLLLAATTVFADVPTTVNYQGFLTNPSGSPLDTTVQMTFQLYQGFGGPALWTEVQPSVIVSSGRSM